MENKSWRWRRKSSEKTVVDDGRASLSLEGDVEEGEERVGPAKCLSNISDKSASVICDCNAKDELIRMHARIAEQALAGQKMAAAEAAYFKQELDKALQQGEPAEQKLANLNAALKECMQEIESLRDGQKVLVDFEKEKRKLDGKLAEASKRMVNLSAENANLMKALLYKEKLVQDLDKGKEELEAEFGMLMDRLDSAEKENTLLKYEFHMMEKELELQNEEWKNSRRSELENAKQVKKLEAECQELRNLVRKRLQGLIAPLNTKRSNPRMGDSPEKSGRGTSFLIDRAFNMEEENKMLKEMLALSNGELRSWRVKYGQMASRVAELKAQLNELSEAENSMQLAISDLGLSNYDEVCDSESWANALLAELEQFRQEKNKNEPEMEKYAIVSTDTQGSGKELQSTSKELVPISVDSMSNKEKGLLSQGDSWLDKILKVILEEHRVSQRNMGELLQDILIALGYDNLQKNDNHSSDIRGLLTWKSSDSTPTESSTLASFLSNSMSVEDTKGQNVTGGSFASEKIRKRFSIDRSKSDNRMVVGSLNRHDTLAQMIAIQSAMHEENRQVKEKLQSVIEENISLGNQLQESKQTIESLERELESLKESKGLTEEQVENERLINEDLDTQLTVAKAKQNEILHKLSSLEVELEDKNNCCEELETTCLELQLQLETFRLSKKEFPENDTNQVEKILRTETIQNLAKQLKALPSPDATQFDELPSPDTTSLKIQNSSLIDNKSLAIQRSTLRDRMLEDSGDQTDGLKNLRTKEEESYENSEKKSVNDTEFKALPPPPGLKVQSLEEVSTLALVPSKKPGGGFGFIRKLFLRRRKGSSKTKAAPLQRNTSTLKKQRDVLLVI
ncbi:filament-like plant protein 7 [Chenopodium quinoa]|uniref:filament-like plant protein 7 n=1 Tax=Chenopodium quinoa TaxID=63459 RepID=UPI000B76C077|nr:filament-like plant protein 7 [Chenopodium quinoa]XP_021753336.1 filament-like plant protein 7 [Chenopodium quinoa]